jgi:flavin-dependent dehydrogenase
VVGADGRNSLVASAVNAPKYKEVPPLLCWYYTYWAGVQDIGFAGATRGDRKLLFIPTNDGLTCILIGWPSADFARVRANLESEYLEALQFLSPQIAERVRGSTPAEPYRGMADLPNFFRKPYGAGWALVGDAGYHRDPVAAHGISDAVRDAGILAEELQAGLSGDKPLERALADYEERRNEAAFPLYEQNLRAASLGPPPAEELRLRTALRDARQEDIDAFMGARYGTLPREAFFNPENLARIFRESEARQAATGGRSA